MKVSLTLAVALLLALGCERNRTTTCVTGASSACVCATGAPGAQTCQSDGTFGACQCAPAPMPVPVAVAPPVVPVVPAAPTPAPAAPHVPTAPHAHAPAAAPGTAPIPGMPSMPGMPGMPTITMPGAPTQGAAPTAAPAGNPGLNAAQLGQIGQLLSQGLNPQQVQSITDAFSNANRSQAPDHPTFSPTQLTQLTQMANQNGGGPSALQSAAQSMLGGH